MPPQPRLQFLMRPGGARLAYTTWGSGLPLVRAPGWVSNQASFIQSPAQAQFADLLASLSPPWMQVNYDKQGTGLSDRSRADLSLESLVDEFEAVVDHLRLRRFALFCASGGGPIGITYAVRHPERVSRIIFGNSYARSATAITPQLRDATAALVRAEWRVGSETLGHLFHASASADELQAFAQFQREAASPEMAASLWQTYLTCDVAALATRVSAPSLVLHARGDRVISFEAGVELAALLPDAHFMPVESANHAVTETGRQDPNVYRAIAAFLGEETAAGAVATEREGPHPAVVASHAPLTHRQLQVLRLIAAGKSSREVAAELILSERTVQRHIADLYTKIGARNRAEATAFALRLLQG